MLNTNSFTKPGVLMFYVGLKLPIKVQISFFADMEIFYPVTGVNDLSTTYSHHFDGLKYIHKYCLTIRRVNRK